MDIAEAKGKCAVAELVETERHYVASLYELLQEYYWPLVNVGNDSCPLCFTSEHGKILFGNLAQILDFNTLFLQELRTSVSKVFNIRAVSASLKSVADV